MIRPASIFALLALAACNRPEVAPASPDPAAPSSPEAAAVGPASTSPLGSGRTMTGSLSPLTGQVTAFQVEETPTEIIVELAADVLFAFDSADLSAQAPEQLNKTLAQIQRGGAGDIQVIGHTDAEGEDAYNEALSLRRARAVADWLSAEGVDSARLEPQGRGEREPIAPNQSASGADDPQGRARNRRVQIVIPKV